MKTFSYFKIIGLLVFCLFANPLNAMENYKAQESENVQTNEKFIKYFVNYLKQQNQIPNKKIKAETLQEKVGEFLWNNHSIENNSDIRIIVNNIENLANILQVPKTNHEEFQNIVLRYFEIALEKFKKLEKQNSSTCGTATKIITLLTLATPLIYWIIKYSPDGIEQ